MVAGRTTRDWVAAPGAFPLSPALPFQPSADGYAVGAVKRFVENLLPEGRALDITATTYRVSKSNIYALISALGTETTGAFRFWRSDEVPPVVAAKPPREVTREELDKRIAERDQIPLAVWDDKVRMSIAGVQDKLMVYLDGPMRRRRTPVPGRAATWHRPTSSSPTPRVR